MSRMMQTRLAKLEAHKDAQGPIRRVPQSERDAAVRAYLASGQPIPIYGQLGDNLAQQRNAAVAAALRADA